MAVRDGDLLYETMSGKKVLSEKRTISSPSLMMLMRCWSLLLVIITIALDSEVCIKSYDTTSTVLSSGLCISRPYVHVS